MKRHIGWVLIRSALIAVPIVHVQLIISGIKGTELFTPGFRIVLVASPITYAIVGVIYACVKADVEKNG